MNPIRAIRNKHNLKQAELAKRLGLSQSYISKIEVKKIPPNTKCLVALEREFKINGYLLLKSYNEDWE